MLKEKDCLLDELVQLFLSYRDVDEAYCRVVSRLNRSEVDISIGEVQRRAYECREGKRYEK